MRAYSEGRQRQYTQLSILSEDFSREVQSKSARSSGAQSAERAVTGSCRSAVNERVHIFLFYVKKALTI